MIEEAVAMVLGSGDEAVLTGDGKVLFVKGEVKEFVKFVRESI
jgi:hypothetical protein